jgi:hypothetical protein
MPPLIFRHMLLDHQSVCKEHGQTIIIKHLKRQRLSVAFGYLP